MTNTDKTDVVHGRLWSQAYEMVRSQSRDGIESKMYFRLYLPVTRVVRGTVRESLTAEIERRRR